MNLPAPSVVLEAVCLSKTFSSPGQESAFSVLESVSFQLEEGQTLSICGQSGSGKSTLLNLLAGLEKPSSGKVLWNGVELEQVKPEKLARIRSRTIGFVFQSFYLMPELNVIENVVIAGRLAGLAIKDATERAEMLLCKVGLQHRLRHEPAKLSGGERQRVAFARALLNQPKLILADEPTGNLDEHTAGGIMDSLLEVCAKEKTALILVTHNPVFAQRCNSRRILSGGNLAAC